MTSTFSGGRQPRPYSAGRVRPGLVACCSPRSSTISRVARRTNRSSSSLEQVAFAVPLGVVQGRDEQVVEDLLGRRGLGLRLHQVLRLVLVAGEQALVVGDVRLQGRLVAQEHGEELQLRDVPAQDDQADGQRAGQDQADRPPQEGPEGGGDQQGDLGHADALAVQPRLHDVVADQFQDHQEAHDQTRRVQPSNMARLRVTGRSAATGAPT